MEQLESQDPCSFENVFYTSWERYLNAWTGEMYALKKLEKCTFKTNLARYLSGFKKRQREASFGDYHCETAGSFLF